MTEPPTDPAALKPTRVATEIIRFLAKRHKPTSTPFIASIIRIRIYETTNPVVWGRCLWLENHGLIQRAGTNGGAVEWELTAEGMNYDTSPSG